MLFFLSALHAGWPTPAVRIVPAVNSKNSRRVVMTFPSMKHEMLTASVRLGLDGHDRQVVIKTLPACMSGHGIVDKIDKPSGTRARIRADNLQQPISAELDSGFFICRLGQPVRVPHKNVSRCERDLLRVTIQRWKQSEWHA